MGGRPWLEVLKGHSIRRDREQEEARDAIFADAPSDELTKPTKAPAPVVNITTAPRDEDERRLIAAGWGPKERCGPLGLTIWADPRTGFYCSRDVALHRLSERSGVSVARNGPMETGQIDRREGGRGVSAPAGNPPRGEEPWT